MPRKAFYSFHYQPDNWRASQVRNIGAIEGNSPCSDNDWERVTKGGDERIRKWISDQLAGRSCVVVLIGANTADRKWVKYEIVKGWNDGKGVVGVHVHNLLDSSSNQAVKGANPFARISLGSSGRLSSIVKAYDPPYSGSTFAYAHIKTNLAVWVDEAIAIRNRTGGACYA